MLNPNVWCLNHGLFHLIFHGETRGFTSFSMKIPWWNPAFFPGWKFGTPSFPWLKPVKTHHFPLVFHPAFFGRWTPRTARRSAARPGVTSTRWRRSFRTRREGRRPERRRRRPGKGGKCGVFPWFFDVFPGFFEVFPWFFEVFPWFFEVFPWFF